MVISDKFLFFVYLIGIGHRDIRLVIKMKPFLKWAGNKYHVIEQIKQALPSGNRLIEPFAGSCSVFLNTQYKHYILADGNSDLINMYLIIKESGSSFIKYAKSFFTEKNNNDEAFYKLRRSFNTTVDVYLKSALFIYLNKHCFNGLCRYNDKGEFNASFGKYKKPYFPEKELSNFYNKSKSATFQHADFSITMKSAKSGDIIYCDPPYLPLSSTANFNHYCANGFDLSSHKKLALLAEQAANKGIPVIISNHNTKLSLSIYQNADSIIKFDVQRYISCVGSKRGKASEILAIFK